MSKRPLVDLRPTHHRLRRAEKTALVEAKGRLVLLGCLLLLGFILVGGRLLEIGVLWILNHEAPKTPHRTLSTTRRATILDAQGEILATNLTTASVFANPREILDMQEVLTELPKALPQVTTASLKKKLAPRADGTPKSFVWLARNITPTQQAAVLKLGLPGIQFLTEEKRVYPHGVMAAHVVGFTDIDNQGLAGVERAFNDQLVHRETPLRLSLDLRVQAVVEDELGKAVAKFHAVGGSAIVLNARTGAVVAMATLPTFNPNNPLKINKDHLFNPNVLGIYDMGSIFKIFTVAMALDANAVTLKHGFDATHPIKVGRFTITDFNGGERRWLSVPEIILHSSNIGTAKMALHMGSQVQQAYFQKFGFFDKVPIELMERGNPLLPKQWSDVSTMTIAYGYGLSVSPLHALRAFAALVNGGTLITPTLLYQPQHRVGGKVAKPIPVGPQVVDPATSELVRKLAYLVVKRGTGKKAHVDGLFVGAKTGTAEKRNKGGRGFLHTSNITSFLGAFPIHDPDYVIFVMLDEAQAVEGTYGFRSSGWNAAPTAGAMIRRIAPLLALRPGYEHDPEVQKKLDIPGITTPPSSAVKVAPAPLPLSRQPVIRTA